MACAEPSRDALDRLLSQLDLEPRGHDRLAARAPERSIGGRLFGGLIVAQALVAAGRTTPGRVPHSLHGYFLRPGRLGRELTFCIERLRDGRRLATRRVRVEQEGRTVFELLASFEKGRPGELDQHVGPPPTPEPEGLIEWEELRARELGLARPRHPDAIEVRVWEQGEASARGGLPRHERRMWMRPRGTVPRDALLRAAILAYASDRTLLRTAARAHGWPVQRGLAASLDHALWFHAPVRWDGWLLYACESPVASGERAWVRGRFFDEDGLLVATVAQEGIVAGSGPRRRAASRAIERGTEAGS